MKCEYEDELTAYLDGELPAVRAAQVRQHAAGCPSCSGTLALLKETLSQLALLPGPAPSAALRRNVLTQIALQEERWGLRRWLRPSLLLPLGTAAAVVVATLWLRTDRLGQPPGLLLDQDRLELAANLEVLEELELVGLESAEDLDVLMNLEELEAMP